MASSSCELGCSTSPIIRQMVKSELCFLEGAMKDIASLKSRKNFLLRPRLTCEGFTGVTHEEKQKEELTLMRKIVQNSGMKDSMKCICPENVESIEKMKILYSEELFN